MRSGPLGRWGEICCPSLRLPHGRRTQERGLNPFLIQHPFQVLVVQTNVPCGYCSVRDKIWRSNVPQPDLLPSSPANIFNLTNEKVYKNGVQLVWSLEIDFPLLHPYFRKDSSNSLYVVYNLLALTYAKTSTFPSLGIHDVRRILLILHGYD